MTVPIVADASALVEYILQTPGGDRVRDIARRPAVELHAPALCDIEVSSALRRALLMGKLTPRRVQSALEDYLDFPITRHGHRHLLARILVLRNNFSAYDATYLALAERLGASLLTADEALGRAVGSHSSVRVD